jgi:hypothetical protein
MSKLLSDGEIKKEGAFSKNIFETLQFAYKPYLFKIFLALILGLFGRGLLLANTNVIGYWVDSLIGQKSPLEGWGSSEIIFLLFSRPFIFVPMSNWYFFTLASTHNLFQNSLLIIFCCNKNNYRSYFIFCFNFYID